MSDDSSNLRAGAVQNGSPSRKRGRPYDPAVLERLTIAGLALLQKEDPSALTIEQVCLKARVSRATFYRRWRSINPIFAAMATHILAEGSPAIDERDDLRSTLLHSVEQRARLLEDPRIGALFHFAFARAGQDPEMRGIIQEIDQQRNAPILALLKRAQTAGEVRADTSMDYVTHQLFGPVWHRVLLLGLPTDHRFAETLVDGVLAALAPPKKI